MEGLKQRFPQTAAREEKARKGGEKDGASPPRQRLTHEQSQSTKHVRRREQPSE